ncbi:hypothetical protein V5739_12160 [Salinimicrobium sp. TIG7-5_MAKvit]|uniref:hypothetical protein n=1 Tax=Salinimicrobium sp. TIG7-5_MAKvit TaxID=3121289 RepID=UPI003C6E2734
MDQLMRGFVDVEGNYMLAGWTDSGASGDKSQVSRGSRDGWVIKLDPPELDLPSVNTPDPYIACEVGQVDICTKFMPGSGRHRTS